MIRRLFTLGMMVAIGCFLLETGTPRADGCEGTGGGKMKGSGTNQKSKKSGSSTGNMPNAGIPNTGMGNTGMSCGGKHSHGMASGGMSGHGMASGGMASGGMNVRGYAAMGGGVMANGYLNQGMIPSGIFAPATAPSDPNPFGTNPAPSASIGVTRTEPTYVAPATSSSSSSLDSMNRMRYVLLNVTGVKGTRDTTRIETNLGEMKQVRSVNIKRQWDGSTTVKVWYSDREPLQAAALVEATNKLGYKAVVAESN